MSTATPSASSRSPTSSRRHALEELRRHAPRPRRVLRLRRDRVHDRHELPQDPAGAPRGDGDVGRAGYSAGPMDVFPEEFATFLLWRARVRKAFPQAPPRPARAEVLAGRAAHPRRPVETSSPTRSSCASASSSATRAPPERPPELPVLRPLRRRSPPGRCGSRRGYRPSALPGDVPTAAP